MGLPRLIFLLAVMAGVPSGLACTSVTVGLIQQLPGGPDGWTQPMLSATTRWLWEQAAAARLAVLVANNSTSLLPNCSVHLQMADSSTDTGVAAVSLLTSSAAPVALLGLAAQDVAVTVRLAEHFRVPVLSDAVSAVDASDSTPLFTSTVASESVEVRGLVDLAVRMKWTSIVVFFAPGVFDIAAFNTQIAARQITIAAEVAVSSKMTVSSLRAQLEMARGLHVYTLFLMALPADADALLSQARALGMFGAPYTWVGSHHWLEDISLVGTQASVVNGAVGFRAIPVVNRSSEKQSEYVRTWETFYRANPNNTFGIASPITNSQRFDTTTVLMSALHSYAMTMASCSSPATNATAWSRFTAYPSSPCTNSSLWDTTLLQSCCFALKASTAGQRNPFSVPLVRFIRLQSLQGIFSELRWATVDTGAVAAPFLGVVNVRDGVARDVGVYSNSTGFTFNRSIVWADNTTTTPLSAPVASEVLEAPSRAVLVGVLCAACISIVYALALVFFNVRWRRHRVMKMSSPNINLIVLLGALLAHVFTVVNAYTVDWAHDDSSRFHQLCSAQAWLISLAFTLSFGSLVAKSYRVHYIFNSSLNVRLRKVSDTYLAAVVGVMVLVDIILLTTWTVVDPLELKTTFEQEEVDPSNLLVSVIERRTECTSDHVEFWVSLVLAYKLLVLVFGGYIAFKIRNIEVEAANDSQWIGFAIYNLCLLCVVLVPLSLTADISRNARTLVVTLGIIIMIDVVLSLLFVPKMVSVWYDETLVPTNKYLQRSPGGQAGTTPVSALDGSVGDELLLIKLGRLQARNAELENELIHLKNKLNIEQHSPRRSETMAPLKTDASRVGGSRWRYLSPSHRSNGSVSRSKSGLGNGAGSLTVPSPARRRLAARSSAPSKTAVRITPVGGTEANSHDIVEMGSIDSTDARQPQSVAADSGGAGGATAKLPASAASTGADASVSSNGKSLVGLGVPP